MRSPEPLLACTSIQLFVALLLSVGSVAHCRELKQEFDLNARIADVTQRSSWNHNYVLPQRALAKGMTVVGDNSRTKNFMRKMIEGKPVKYALLGGSISTQRGAPHGDMQWHGVMQKWFELTFTECGHKFPDLSVRLHSPEWTNELHTCNDNQFVTACNMAIGSSGAIFAEKCLAQKIPKDVDLVILEYTMNSLDPASQAIISNGHCKHREAITGASHEKGTVLSVAA
eukprot:gene22975-30164_t